MDVTALRWFQQVADGATVTEVSALVGVTQPGVSRALARLEAEVGIELLRRSGRTLRMTRAGSAFKRHVDRMLHELDDGLAELSGLAAPESGTVSLAFQLSLGSWLVPQLLASFRARHPGVRFELRQSREDADASPVLTGVAEMELTTSRATGAGIRWRPIASEPLLLAVPTEHRLATRSSVALGEVAEEPFVMLRATYALRRLAEQLCRAAGFTPTVAFEGDDLLTVAGLVGVGLGVAIVPMPRRTPTDSGVRLLRITDEGATREIGIAWSTARKLLPSAERFRKHVLTEGRAGVL